MRIEILPTLGDLARAAAEDFVAHATRCVAANGRFTVALTGGTTPREAYELLGSAAYISRVDWSRVHVFWGDERCVPPDDSASNYRMARIALLDPAGIPKENVYRMRGEAEPAAAAAEYEELINDIVGERFDLIHLGMGADAHVASLFAGSPALKEWERRVCAQFIEDVGMWRITLTPAAINGAAHITFIVAGAQKASAVAHVLEGPRTPEMTPAQIVVPAGGDVLWLIDRLAAAELDVGGLPS